MARVRPILSKVFVTTLLSLGTGVLIQNLYLNRELQKLREPSTEIPQGTHLGRIEGYSIEGKLKVLTKNDLDHALLITFSPTCGSCLKNADEWSVLVDQLHQKGGWHVFWISRDSFDMTRTYCLEHHIPQEDVLADPPYRTYLQMRMQGVPSTLIVESGAVKKQWIGPLQPTQWGDIFASFGLQAPNNLQTKTGCTAGCT